MLIPDELAQLLFTSDDVLFDLDCVLADFRGGCSLLFDHPPSYLDDVGYELSNALGVPRARFKAAIAFRGAEFWRQLAPLSDALWWYRKLKLMGVRCTVVSDDGGYPGAVDGKRAWMGQHLGPDYRVVFTEHKALLSRPGRVLIDDSVFHVDAFRVHGGDAILWRTDYAGSNRDRRTA